MIAGVVSRTASLFASVFDSRATDSTTDTTPARAQAKQSAKADSLRYLPPPGLAGWSALPERDRRLLEWLVVSEFVTADLAALLAYGSLRVAQRRLARLRDYRLVSGFWTANTQRPRGRYAYRLTESCRAELERLVWADSRPPHQPRGDQRSVIHHLAVLDLLGAFVRSRQPSIGLIAWLPERICGTLFEGYLRPDGIAAIGLDDRLVLAFVERDTGTERIAVLHAKARRYAAVIGSRPELAPAHVIFVTHSGRRARTILNGLRSMDGLRHPSLWVTSERDMAGALWSTSLRSTRAPDIELRSLPGHPLPAFASRLGPGCLLDPDQADGLDERAISSLPMLRQLARRSGLL